MFALYASKNQLEILEKEPVTSGSVNVYKVRFEFSEDWQGLTRKAVFQAGEVSRSALLDENGECVIPWEVLAEYHPLTRLRAGAYGSADETALPTVWADLGIILQGVPSSGKETQQPTPDIYQQIASLAAKAEETARSVREDADAGKFDGEIGPKGEKGDKGDTGPQGPVGTPGMPEADVLSAIGAAVSSPAHMITETYGPAAEVTVDIAAEGSLLHPVSEIKLVQEGEGTPSLTNIRNITGWSSITLTHNGTATTQALPEAVYGGIYDWFKDELTVTHKMFALSVADMDYEEPGYIGWKNKTSELLECFPADVQKNFVSCPSNMVNAIDINMVALGGLLVISKTRLGFEYGTTILDSFKAQYPDLISHFVLPLLEPRTIQLAPHESLALSGTNTFSSNCGDTTVTFTSDLKKYIDKKLSELTKEAENETV